MEYRKFSLFDFCIFIENDGVDFVFVVVLFGVRWVVFGVVLFWRGGGRGGDVELWRLFGFRVFF